MTTSELRAYRQGLDDAAVSLELLAQAYGLQAQAPQRLQSEVLALLASAFGDAAAMVRALDPPAPSDPRA